MKKILLCFLMTMLIMPAWADDIIKTDAITVANMNVSAVIDYSQAVLTSNSATFNTTTYTPKDVFITSGAEYASTELRVNKSGNNLDYQIRNSNKGKGVFYVTKSGGILESIKFTTGLTTTTMKVTVYGSDTPYSGTGDSYGDEIGKLEATGVLTPTKDYTYFTFIATSGTTYINEIDVKWKGSSTPVFPTTCAVPTFNFENNASVHAGDVVTATCATPNSTVRLVGEGVDNEGVAEGGVVSYTIPETAAVGSTITLTANARVQGETEELTSSATITLQVVEKPQVATYTQIKSTSDLVAGKKYVIAHYDASQSYAMSTEVNTKTRKATKVDITDGVLTETDEVLVLTLGGTVDNWTWYAPDYKGENKYLKPSNSANEVNMSDSPFPTIVSFSTQGNVEIKTTEANDTRNIKFYSGAPDFRSYTSANGVVVQLYKYDEPAAPDPIHANIQWNCDTENVVLNVGDSKTLAVKVVDDSGNTLYNFVKIDSSNPDVVSVTDNITLNAVAPGSATITAKLYDNDTAYEATPISFDVTVVEQNPEQVAKPTVVKLDGSVLEDCATIYVNDPIIISSSTEGATLAYQIESDNDEFVSVDEISDTNSVEVKINKAGTITITAFAVSDNLEDSETLELTIDVVKRKAGISFDAETSVAYLDEDYESPEFANPNNLDIEFDSDDPEVAEIDPATGKVTVIGLGTTTISALTEGNDEFEEDIVGYVLTVEETRPQMTSSEFTFDFVNNDYGMIRHSTSYESGTYNDNAVEIYNDETTKLFGIKLEGSDSETCKNRLWGDGWRIHGGSKIEGSTPTAYTECKYTFELTSQVYDMLTVELTGDLVKNSNISITADGYDAENAKWTGKSKDINFAISNSAKGGTALAAISIKFEHEVVKQPIHTLSEDMVLTLSHEKDDHSIWYRFVTAKSSESPRFVTTNSDGYTLYEGEPIDLKEHSTEVLQIYAQHPHGMVSDVLSHVVNDVITGIDTLNSDTNTLNEVWFNMQGVRVANPTDGIYIRVRNGKAEKVIR